MAPPKRKPARIKAQARGASSSALMNDSAQRIRQLRADLGINQYVLSRKLQISQQSISAWEKAQKLPSAEMFIRLGNFAFPHRPGDGLWFWQRAGFAPTHMKELLPSLKSYIEKAINAQMQPIRNIVLNEIGPGVIEKIDEEAKVKIDEWMDRETLETSLNSITNVIYVPLLKKDIYISTPLLAPDDEIVARIALPKYFVPNPSNTSCLILPNDREKLPGEEAQANYMCRVVRPIRLNREYSAGELVRLNETTFKELLAAGAITANEPLFSERDIVVIDSSQTDVMNLYGKIVVVSILNEIENNNPAELQIGFLDYVYRGSNEYSAIVRSVYPVAGVEIAKQEIFNHSATPSPSWRIVGRIIGWMSKREVTVQQKQKTDKNK